MRVVPEVFTCAPAREIITEGGARRGLGRCGTEPMQGPELCDWGAEGLLDGSAQLLLGAGGECGGPAKGRRQGKQRVGAGIARGPAPGAVNALLLVEGGKGERRGLGPWEINRPCHRLHLPPPHPCRAKPPARTRGDLWPRPLHSLMGRGASVSHPRSSRQHTGPGRLNLPCRPASLRRAIGAPP